MIRGNPQDRTVAAIDEKGPRATERAKRAKNHDPKSRKTKGEGARIDGSEERSGQKKKVLQGRTGFPGGNG
jgi:hypothetical protein